MHYYNAGNHLAHIQMMANPNVNLMVPVEEGPVEEEEQQQRLFKEDIDAAKIIQKMSAKDLEAFRKNGGS